MKRRQFFCALCDEWIEHDAPHDSVLEGIAAADDHFRVLHPDIHAEMERWPDGAPVVMDETLAPRDFEEPSA